MLFFERRPASETSWTKKFWIYDLRTKLHFTLKTRPLVRADLDEFVACYQPGDRAARVETWSAANPGGRWRAYDYDYDARVARD